MCMQNDAMQSTLAQQEHHLRQLAGHLAEAEQAHRASAGDLLLQVTTLHEELAHAQACVFRQPLLAPPHSIEHQGNLPMSGNESSVPLAFSAPICLACARQLQCMPSSGSAPVMNPTVYMAADQ